MLRWIIGCLFLFLSFVKVAALASRAPALLDSIDPLLRIANRHVFAVVAPFEGALGLCWLFPSLFKRCVYATLLLSIGFLVHYLFSGAYRPEHVCPCLGAVAEWLPAVKRNERFITLTITLWLLLVNWALFLMVAKDRQ